MNMEICMNAVKPLQSRLGKTLYKVDKSEISKV